MIASGEDCLQLRFIAEIWGSKMEKLQNQKGFSLIELIIAITIFAVGLLAVTSMQMTSVKGNADSQYISEATYLGQEQLEKLLNLPFDDADLTDTTATGTPHTLTNGNFIYNWLVTDDDILTNTKTIQLDVTYNNRGITKQTRIVAVKADVI